MRKYILFLAFLSISFTSFSQDFSNKGRDFWVAYPDHIDGTTSSMGIYITSDVNTSGTINVAGNIIPFTVIANNVSRTFIGNGSANSSANVYLSQNDGIKINAGIHITSILPVAVYAHIIKSARSGATLVLPTNVWGKEYVVPSYPNFGNSSSYGEIAIMAKEANTTVEITPKAASRNGAHPVGTPFQITLANPGDVYQLQFASSLDASGTFVSSIASGTSGCKPIAVISATTWSGFACAGSSGGDNLYQQLFPYTAWGKSFLTSPLKKVATNGADNNVDIIRVYVKDPTTIVTKIEAGVTTTLSGLTASNFYEYSTSKPTFLQADKSIQVIEFITSQTCGNPVTPSDPEMVVLNSVEQTINDITVFSAHQSYVPAGQSQVTNHYINVIMKTNNSSNFTINGNLPNQLLQQFLAHNILF